LFLGLKPGKKIDTREAKMDREEMEQEKEFESFLKGKVPDFVKKVFFAGVGAFFMTEEGVRNTLSELKLPKEIIYSFIQQTSNTRKELLKLVTGELRSYLSTVNVHGELQKILTGLNVEIKAQVKFIPNQENGTAKIESVVEDLSINKVKT